MKQKIVIKLQMECEKCRNKALKIAAEVEGVTAVSIEGDEKDRMVVTGDNVDAVCLGNQLKRKFRCVIILSMEEVKKPKPDEKKKEEEKPKPACSAVQCHPPPCDPCSKCHSPKCHGQCTSFCKPPPPPCVGPCPPWCSCPKCYVPYPPCPPYRIIYDPCPDSTCSIM